MSALQTNVATNLADGTLAHVAGTCAAEVVLEHIASGVAHPDALGGALLEALSSTDEVLHPAVVRGFMRVIAKRLEQISSSQVVAHRAPPGDCSA